RETPPNLPLVRGGDVTFCSSIQDALEQTKQERSVFVIGGGEVYAQMMPLADEMRISFIHKEYTGDVLFPKIDQRIWQEVSRKEYPLFTHIHYIRNEQPSKNR
ncbi:MAG TPA: dihydrofolate reductase, partial [Candidatus Andersenbacteria bacterium]|nr:dihydrofolate reductase [Candidatus Andersenbacteria bacterium]